MSNWIRAVWYSELYDSFHPQMKQAVQSISLKMTCSNPRTCLVHQDGVFRLTASGFCSHSHRETMRKWHHGYWLQASCYVKWDTQGESLWNSGRFPHFHEPFHFEQGEYWTKSYFICEINYCYLETHHMMLKVGSSLWKLMCQKPNDGARSDPNIDHKRYMSAKK